MVPVGGAARAPAPFHGVDGGDGPPGPPWHHVPPAQLPAPPRLRAGAAPLTPQAAALVGAFVTGLLARKRREQIDGINEKLRQINSEMRRQREEVRPPGWWAGGRAGSPPPPPALAPAPWLAAGGKGCRSPVARAAPPRPASQAAAASGAEVPGALQYRTALERSLEAPSAAHPTESFGNLKLSLARARRQIGACIK
jgi:hypothetical protein